MKYELIQSNDALEAACADLADASLLAVDTEFMRTETFYPAIGLIQLYANKRIFLVDPLGIDAWAPLKDRLECTQSTKLLCAAGEDIEALYHHMNVVVRGLCDVQLLAAFLGAEQNMGFVTLVGAHLGISIEKTQQRTNWLARPLSAEQLAYAASDVEHLLPLGQLLLDRVDKTGWLDAVYQESAQLCSRRIRLRNPKKTYLELAVNRPLSPRGWRRLQKLAEWRLTCAMTENRALNFVIRTPYLIELAASGAQTFHQLRRAGVEGKTLRQYGDALLMVLAEAEQLPLEAEFELPELRSTLPQFCEQRRELKALTIAQAEALGLAPGLLLPRADQEALLLWALFSQDEAFLPEVLYSWRQPFLVKMLLRLFPELFEPLRSLTSHSVRKNSALS